MVQGERQFAAEEPGSVGYGEECYSCHSALVLAAGNLQATDTLRLPHPSRIGTVGSQTAVATATVAAAAAAAVAPPGKLE